MPAPPAAEHGAELRDAAPARQEERHLVALLEDPTDYDRYRARVPALLPRLRRRPRRATR